MSDATHELVKTELNKIDRDFSAAAAKQKERQNELSQKQLELQSRLQELEMKADLRGRSTGGSGSGLSSALLATLDGDAGLARLRDGHRGRVSLDLPAGYIQAAITSVDVMPAPERRADIMAPALRRMTIRDLIPSVATSAGSVQYVREESFTNAAAPVSETVLKPESALTFELKTTAIITIAHWIKTSTQVLADTPQLMRYLDGRLRYGLQFQEEQQLLRGSGVGNNLQGLLGLATPYVAPADPPGTEQRIDIVRLAITQLANAEFVADGIVMNPTDWALLELLKATDGTYIAGMPRGANPATLWNLPVVASTVMNQNEFMVGAFGQAALIFDREQARVDISTENEDDFIRNLATVRCEERLGLAILRPGALVKGMFS